MNVNANAYLGLGFNLGAGYTLLDARNLITDKPIDKSVKYAGNVNAQWSKNWGLYGLNINMVGSRTGKEDIPKRMDYDFIRFYALGFEYRTYIQSEIFHSECRFGC